MYALIEAVSPHPVPPPSSFLLPTSYCSLDRYALIEAVSPLTAAYFVLIVLVGGIFIVQLFLAVILTYLLTCLLTYSLT